jgi:hypothetical protein
LRTGQILRESFAQEAFILQPRFVSEEIRYFKELGKADRILALMIDGEPNAVDDAAKQSAELPIEMECLADLFYRWL